MQLLLLAIILLLFSYDALTLQYGPINAGMGLLQFIGISFSAKLAAMLLLWFVLRRIARHVGRGDVRRRWRRLERILLAYQATIFLLFGMDLAIGGMDALRNAIGNLVLVDELLILLPTLAMLLWQWWAYYPIDRRMRERMVLSRVTEGMPPPKIWSRGGFVVAQSRHQLAITLGPLLIILGWVELAERLGPDGWGWLPMSAMAPLSLLGAAVIFTFLPLVVRFMWDTQPLPVGDVRQFLERMCSQHGVAVRDLLVWRTHGGMINAAVMGLVPRLRYILMTDGLLDQVSKDHVEAIMAHELAHVRKRHIIWLVVSAVAIGGAMQLVWTPVVGWAVWLLPPAAQASEQVGAMWHWLPGGLALREQLAALRSDEVTFGLTLLLASMSWLALFGPVSRRIERQADTFAVQHLVRHRDAMPDSESPDVRHIDAASVQTMVMALQRVADLNQMSIDKKSWRHGSIRWRQDYLRSLVGQPVDRLPIDRRMRWINAASLVAIVAMGLWQWWG